MERVLPPHDRAGERRRRAAADQSSLLRSAGILRQRRRAHPQRPRGNARDRRWSRTSSSMRRLQARARRPRRSGRSAIPRSSSARAIGPTASASTSASPSTGWRRSPTRSTRRDEDRSTRTPMPSCSAMPATAICTSMPNIRRRRTGPRKITEARLRHHRRFRRLDLGRARHRPPQAAVSEAQPHRGGDRDHAHAEARAGPASHSQSRADF